MFKSAAVPGLAALLLLPAQNASADRWPGTSLQGSETGGNAGASFADYSRYLNGMPYALHMRTHRNLPAGSYTSPYALAVSPDAIGGLVQTGSSPVQAGPGA